MIRAAITFFVLALIAYIFGAYQFAGVSMEIGRLFLSIFLVLSVITFLVWIITGRFPKRAP